MNQMNMYLKDTEPASDCMSPAALLIYLLSISPVFSRCFADLSTGGLLSSGLDVDMEGCLCTETNTEDGPGTWKTTSSLVFIARFL